MKNQSSTSKKTLSEKISFVAKGTWNGCKWIWVAIILAIVIGALGNILAGDAKNFVQYTLGAVLKWLISSAPAARVVLVVVILFIVISAVSGIINWLSKEPPGVDYVQDISGQLQKLADNSVAYKEAFIKHEESIHDVTQSQMPQIVQSFRALYEQDLVLKQEDIAQKKELNTHLKELIATIQDSTLRQEDIAQKKELNIHLQELIAEVRGQNGILKRYIQQQASDKIATLASAPQLHTQINERMGNQKDGSTEDGTHLFNPSDSKRP